MTQKTLERIVLGVILAVALVVLFFMHELLNWLVSVVLAVAILLLPFWVDTLIRFKFIPFIDSLNESGNGEGGRRGYYEDFPLWLRVLIWVFLGIVLTLSWSIIVPALFDLHLWLGRLAMSIGWRSIRTADGVWQWGWSVIFIGCYLVNFVAGQLISPRETDFTDRFDYPDD